MKFERVRWGIAFWPPFEVAQIGYTCHISFLFVTFVFRNNPAATPGALELKEDEQREVALVMGAIKPRKTNIT